mmetsp:Transcript_5905/g.14348  ORF Transcript_5905/g.14348 Transcript_5905/m.14348 type:complete len:318 (-) Transcript_5905:37-990(-)
MPELDSAARWIGVFSVYMVCHLANHFRTEVCSQECQGRAASVDTTAAPCPLPLPCLASHWVAIDPVELWSLGAMQSHSRRWHPAPAATSQDLQSLGQPFKRHSVHKAGQLTLSLFCGQLFCGDLSQPISVFERCSSANTTSCAGVLISATHSRGGTLMSLLRGVSDVGLSGSIELRVSCTLSPKEPMSEAVLSHMVLTCSLHCEASCFDMSQNFSSASAELLISPPRSALAAMPDLCFSSRACAAFSAACFISDLPSRTQQSVLDEKPSSSDCDSLFRVWSVDLRAASPDVASRMEPCMVWPATFSVSASLSAMLWM